MVFVTLMQARKVRLLGSGPGSALNRPCPLIALSKILGKGQRQAYRGPEKSR